MTSAAPAPTPPAGTPTRPAQPTSAGAKGSTAASSSTAGGVLEPRSPVRNPSTPRLIRGLLTLCTVLVVLFTTVAAVSLVGARSDFGGAARSVDELGRVYAIRTELLRADAAAAHGSLTGASEPDADPAGALGRARVLLVEASGAEQQDRDALAEVNRRLDAYVAALERARIAQGTPAGAAALGEAGNQLRTQVLPALIQLTSDNSQRVIAQTRGFPGYLLVATGILAVAALLALTVVAAIRFRRVVNLGLLAAVALVIASLAVSGSVLLGAHQDLRDTGRRSIPVLTAISEARTHGFDAYAHEALTVLARDSSPAAQEQWKTAAAETTTALDRPELRSQEPGLGTLWTAYEQAHEAVGQDALAGRWDAARNATGESSRAFAAFDAAAAGVTTATARTVQGELSQPRLRLLLSALLSTLAGLGAIACMVAGLRPRLREYQ